MVDVDALIEKAMADYRDELLAALNRYHGCDRYDNEKSCRSDVYRVDRVTFPVVRKMMEDLVDEVLGGDRSGE